jgi:hypothetical protein
MALFAVLLTGGAVAVSLQLAHHPRAPTPISLVNIDPRDRVDLSAAELGRYDGLGWTLRASIVKDEIFYHSIPTGLGPSEPVALLIGSSDKLPSRYDPKDFAYGQVKQVSKGKLLSLSGTVLEFETALLSQKYAASLARSDSDTNPYPSVRAFRQHWKISNNDYTPIEMDSSSWKLPANTKIPRHPMLIVLYNTMYCSVLVPDTARKEDHPS